MIVHESRNSAFRRPFGAAETGTEVYLAAEKAGAADMTLRLHPFTGEDTLLPMLSEGGGRFSVTVTLPETPCVLWYSFRTGDDETCAWQITVYKKAAVPDWWKDGVVYHIFPDRFARERDWTPREPEARRGTHRFLVRDWDTPVFYPRAENGDVSSWPFWGGTLRGIEEKLPYLASLGVTVLYLNPIFEAASNHRYDTADYTRVDPLLGRKKDFESLCEAARKRGIRIVLDGVFNHTGADSVYFDKFGNYGTAEKYRSWFRFGDQYRHGYECWWDVPDLPNVEENDPSFREFLCGEDGVVRRWLRRGASGWRLDVADELPDVFLEDLRKSVKDADPDALIIGEVWENAADKIAYGKLRKYFQGHQLDSVMNYPLRTALVNFILHKDGRSLARCLTDIYSSYPKFVCDCLMNIIGTHDTERILTVLGDREYTSLSNRELSLRTMSEEEREIGVQRLKIASCIQYTVYGVPSVYYGDEAGVEGGRDPFCRRTYPWGRENGELLQWYKRLGALRRDPVYRDGAFCVTDSGDGYIVYERTKGAARIVSAANVSDTVLHTGICGTELLGGAATDGDVAPMSVSVIRVS